MKQLFQNVLANFLGGVLSVAFVALIGAIGTWLSGLIGRLFIALICLVILIVFTLLAWTAKRPSIVEPSVSIPRFSRRFRNVASICLGVSLVIFLLYIYITRIYTVEHPTTPTDTGEIAQPTPAPLDTPTLTDLPPTTTPTSGTEETSEPSPITKEEILYCKVDGFDWAISDEQSSRNRNSIVFFRTEEPNVFIASSPDGKIRFYNLKAGGLSSGEYVEIDAHQDSLIGIGIEEQGRFLFSTSFDRSLKRWILVDGVITREDESTSIDSEPGAMIYISDFIFLSLQSGDIEVFDLSLSSVQYLEHAHLSFIRSFAGHPQGGRLLSGGADNNINLWSIKKNEDKVISLIRQWRPNAGRGVITALATMNRDIEPLMAVATLGGYISLYKEGDASPVAGPFAVGPDIRSLEFSPDDSILVLGTDSGIIYILDGNSLSPISPGIDVLGISEHRGREEPITSIEFSPNGERIAVANPLGVSLWEICREN